MPLNIPFPYDTYLIGEEIMQRSLAQKEKFAGEGRYEQEWTPEDQLVKAAVFLQATSMRDSFLISGDFDKCEPEPPCPWNKQADIIERTLIKDVIFGANGVYSYNLAVHQSVVTSQAYSIGPKVINYVNNQAALESSIQGEYLYFSRQDISPYLGMSVFVIERLHQGVLDRVFHYLFEMTQ